MKKKAVGCHSNRGSRRLKIETRFYGVRRQSIEKQNERRKMFEKIKGLRFFERIAVG